MEFNTLGLFRQHFYDTITKSKDSLFNCADALLTETYASSFIELSLSPHFERKWPSLYEAFEDGKLDQAALRKLFADFAPLSQSADEPVVVAVDASNIVRPQAYTSPDRGCLYVHNLHECDKPITYGWQFSTLALLPNQPSSWCYILDNSRIDTDHTASEVAAEQLGALANSLVTKRVLVVADRYYGSATFLKALCQPQTQGQVEALLRIKRDRVFYRDPTAYQAGQRGAPRKDGTRFKCSDQTTHGPADRIYQTYDERGGHELEVAAWDNLHFKQERGVKLSLIRLTRHAASGKRGDPRVSWFVFWGKAALALSEVEPTYRRRFSLEHTFRFLKQDLMWEKARLRTPKQFELWSNLVAFVLNELVLAQPLNQAYRRAWESAARQASPQQVWRGMAAIIARLGTPARSVKPRGKAVGRVKGTLVQRYKRYEVVKKRKIKQKTVKKAI